MAPTSTHRAARDDATGRFFDDLAARGNEPLLRRVTGSVRFDVTDGAGTAQYLVEMAKGDITVSHRPGHPDAVVHADRADLDRVVEGRTNAMAAVLRGRLQIDGDIGAVSSFLRLVPGPPESTETFVERQRRIGRTVTR
ncbi:MAG TPA: SCP2 sterol-binding domain-containing protein [Acidimicrobiales bacterium]|nr:SCP2 sterol-binding domain-containing protein [Acidimicrobiales bacterium]